MINPISEFSKPPINEPAVRPPVQETSPKEQTLEIFSTPENFVAESKKMVETLKTIIPEEIEAFEEFCDQNQQTIDDLHKNGGWMNHKKDLSPDEKQALDKFRSEAVNHITTVCIATVKAMGYSDPGIHTASGTPGVDSDIDTVYLAHPSVPETVQSMEKLLFDMVSQEMLGGLSGHLIDTESYLNHAADALETEKHLYTDCGKSDFARIELTASSLQMLKLLGGPKNSQWKAFKERQLAQLDGKLKKVVEDIYRETESFYSKVEEGIQSEMDSGNHEKIEHAQMTYKTKVLMNISQEMDNLNTKIKNLEIQMTTPQKSGGLFANRHVQMHELVLKVEEARLKLATLYLLRTSFFDEGYNTQGAFAKVCRTLGGQTHERTLEKFQGALKKLSLRPEQLSPQSELEENSPTGSPHSPLFARIGSYAKKTLSSRSRRSSFFSSRELSYSSSEESDQDLRRDSIAESINALRESGIQYQTTESQRTKATATQLLFSMLENYSMYLPKHINKTEGQDFHGKQKALIKNSKYSERVLKASIGILEISQEKKTTLKENPFFQGLLEKCKSLHKIAFNLEKAKRKVKLPPEIFQKEMETILLGKTKHNQDSAYAELEKSEYSKIEQATEEHDKKIQNIKDKYEGLIDNLPHDKENQKNFQEALTQLQIAYKDDLTAAQNEKEKAINDLQNRKENNLKELREEHKTQNENLKRDIKKFSETMLPEGKLGSLAFEESITAEERYLSLSSKFLSLDLSDSSELPMTTNKKFNDLIRLYVGSEVEADDTVEQLIEKNHEILFENLGLNYEAHFENFNLEIEMIITLVLNQAVESGTVSLPSLEQNENYSLEYLLDKIFAKDDKSL